MTVGRIWANGEDKGSGFALATPHSRTTRVVLTAKHIIGNQEPSSLQFLTEDKRRIPVERVEGDDDLDVAILHLSEDVAEGLAVSRAVEGGSWQVETRPRPNDPKLYGTITDTNRPFVKQDGVHEIHVLQLDEKQNLGDYKGYSGSPVVLKSPTDAVIGVLIEQLRSRLSVPTGQPKPATNVLYAIPIQDVLDRFGLRAPMAESSVGRLDELRRRVGPLLLGIALMCGIALYPLFPPTINLIAENVSSSSVGLLILALLGIGCFELVPLLFGAVFGPWIGFFIGSVGVLLSGLLANVLAAHDYPTKVQASFDLSSGQSSWIWFLIAYSLCIGLSAWLTGFRVRGKTAGSLGVRGDIILLFAAGISLLIALAFSLVTLSFSVLYPLLAVSNQTQAVGGATVLFAALFVLAGLLFPVLPLLIHHMARIRSWIRAHKWWRYGALAAILILLALPPLYELNKFPSVHLQGQDFPLDIPLGCNTCDPLYFQIALEGIKLDQNTSIWHISLTNPAVCREIAFMPQSIVIHDAFSTVYQPISFSGLDNHQALRLAQGASQEVYLRYQIVPKSTHHLWLDLSLHVTSCPGDKNVDEEVQGSQMLLFQ